MTDVLRRDWGFDGMVTSDWGIHGPVSVQAGNDLEMPTGAHRPPAHAPGRARRRDPDPDVAVDDAARRILRTVIRVGLLDAPAPPDPAVVGSPEHRQIALEAATKGIVLLKNENGFLPLSRQRVRSVAIIGDAGRTLQYGPLGSPAVSPLHTSDLLETVRRQLDRTIPVRFVTGRREGEPVTGAVVTPPGGDPLAHGFRAEYFRNRQLAGAPDLVRVEDEIDIFDRTPAAPGFPVENYSVRWTGTLLAPVSGRYKFTFAGDDGYRLFIDSRPVIDQWDHPNGMKNVSIDLEAGHSYDLRAEFFQAGGDVRAQLTWRPPGEGDYAAAIDAARHADATILCVSTQRMESEGRDRPVHGPAGRAGRPGPRRARRERAHRCRAQQRHPRDDGRMDRANARRAGSMAARPGGRGGAGRNPLRGCEPVRSVARHTGRPARRLSGRAQLPR